MLRLPLLVFACAVAPLCGAPPAAHAADCNARQSAGYRVLTMDNGRKVAVWYPAAAAEVPTPYSRSNNGFLGRVARDAPPVLCPRTPLVLFSHGWSGCGLQSIFITEEIARHGYVVAAPDHADAVCKIDSAELSFGNLRLDQSFLDPKSWNDRSEIGRLHDLRAVVDLVASDAQLGRITDASRVGVVGHSLGGYAAVAMSGGWPAWRTPEVKAVVAMSPYVAPFLAHGTLPQLEVPVMYQGAMFDWGITPMLEGPDGAYAASPPPKFFMKLRAGTHMEWTNFLCAREPSVVACLKAQPNAYLIDRYAIEFLDQYLKNKRGLALTSAGSGLSVYQYELR